jgi:hypothetical protein
LRCIDMSLIKEAGCIMRCGFATNDIVTSVHLGSGAIPLL